MKKRIAQWLANLAWRVGGGAIVYAESVTLEHPARVVNPRVLNGCTIIGGVEGIPA